LGGVSPELKKHSAEVTACLYTLWGEGGELLFLTIWYRKYIMTDETIDLDELDKEITKKLK